MILICTVILAASFGVAFFQILWTRTHRKNLEKHDKRVEEIYKRYRS